MGGARRALESGVEVSGHGLVVGSVYEANIELNLRFMVDKAVSGCCWIQLPAGQYRVRRPSDKKSLCQVQPAYNGPTLTFVD